MRAWTTVWAMIGVNIGAGIYLTGSTGLRFEYLVHLAGAIGGWAFMEVTKPGNVLQLLQAFSMC